MRCPSFLCPLIFAIGFGFPSDTPLYGQSTNPASLDESQCAEVIATMKAAIAKEPGRLILCMEDALTTQESCTCTIVKEAVSYAGEDHALIGQLVIAAIRMVPSAAARITECTMETAPAAESAVQMALNKELGKKSSHWLTGGAPPEPASENKASAADPVAPIPGGKAPAGKSPVPAPALENSAQEIDSFEIMDFAHPLIGVSGVYLIPTAGRPGLQISSSRPLPGPVILTTKTKPFRPVSAVTKSNPD